MHYDCIVIGGGFYGLSLALQINKEQRDLRVLILEAEPEVMRRASYVNQARVHNGYHYPRSLLTGLRSRILSPKFINEFKPAIVDDFQHIYAIPSKGSKVTANQFQLFSERISAPIQKASGANLSLFNLDKLSGVFEVVEPAFDSTILKNLVLEKIDSARGIRIQTCTAAIKIEKNEDKILQVTCNTGEVFTSPKILCAIYSKTNDLLRNSELPVFELQHELTEIALFSPPNELEHKAITVMDGPFFSIMPFPAEETHSLTHVRYTPRTRWIDGSENLPHKDIQNQELKVSGFPAMLADANRYIPSLRSSRYKGSLWEIKTVLTKSEENDSRPILMKQDHGLPGLTFTLGGKIDNIYDSYSAVN